METQILSANNFINFRNIKIQIFNPWSVLMATIYIFLFFFFRELTRLVNRYYQFCVANVSTVVTTSTYSYGIKR